MHNAALLHAFDSVRELPHEHRDLRLRQQPLILAASELLLDKLVELLRDAVLHQEVDVLVILEEMVELRDVGTVVQLPVHHDLLSYPLSQVLRPQIFLVNDLEGKDLERLATPDLVDEGSGTTSECAENFVVREGAAKLHLK